MRLDINCLQDLVRPILANLDDLKAYSSKSSQMPPRSNQPGTGGEYIPLNDPLVNRSHQIEKRVHECLNKLHSQKLPAQTNSYMSPKNQAPKHEQIVMYRSPIELEFKKKKIHFVSEFKLYDERWQFKLI